MKLVACVPLKTTVKVDVPAGADFEEPDADRVAFLLQTGAACKPGSSMAATAKRAAGEGIPIDYALGLVDPKAVLAGKVQVGGVTTERLRRDAGLPPAAGRGAVAPDGLPPVADGPVDGPGDDDKRGA